MDAPTPSGPSHEGPTRPLPPPTRRTSPPWPRWASAALVGSGVVVIALDTTNLLVVLGVLLLAVGIFGLARRRPSRAGAATAADRTPG
jgi:LPXTG-motif cell wall-anchored protein